MKLLTCVAFAPFAPMVVLRSPAGVLPAPLLCNHSSVSFRSRRPSPVRRSPICAAFDGTESDEVTTERSAAFDGTEYDEVTTERTWQCMNGCGACCFLGDYDDDTLLGLLKSPSDVETYLDMIGADGWCRHFDKEARNCKQYENRPAFCRVEFSVFESLYGVRNPEEMDSFAIECCEEHISGVYPSFDDCSDSKELRAFRELTSSTMG